MDHFPLTGTYSGFTGAGGERDESRGLHDKHGLHASAKRMETEMVHLDLQATSHIRTHTVFKYMTSHPKAFLSSYLLTRKQTTAV